MNKQQFNQVLNMMADDMVKENVDIWPALKKTLSGSTKAAVRPSRGQRMLRSSVYAVIALAVIAIFFLFTPQGKVFAQEVVNFFHRADSDALPLQAFQMTPISPDQTYTPDPASILDANASIDEITAQAGFTVLQPALIPDGYAFSGASFDAETSTTRLFYQLQLDVSNGFAIKQQLIGQGEECDLCGEVGNSADIVDVSINGASGQYVVGVWKLTDNGPVWESDPYLQTLRWQANGFAYELLYMGSPDYLTKDQVVSIAESMQ